MKLAFKNGDSAHGVVGSTRTYAKVAAKSAQLGLLCMLICEVAEAFRSAGMQYLLANKSFTLFDGLYYFSPATLIFLGGLVYVFEWEDIKDADHMAAVKVGGVGGGSVG